MSMAHEKVCGQSILFCILESLDSVLGELRFNLFGWARLCNVVPSTLDLSIPLMVWDGLEERLRQIKA